MCSSVKCWTLVCMIFHPGILFISANGRKHCPDVVQKSRYHVATHNRTCYLFIAKERYWDDARRDCWQMGGEMLVIPNSETMNFLIGELRSPRLGWTVNGVWNGANDIEGTGWEWTTGEKLKYSYWSSGQPGAFLDLFSFENCACMRQSDGWRWHDYACHAVGYKYNYVCQFGFLQSHTDQMSHTGDGSPLVAKDDFVTVLGLAVGGVILLALVTSITYYLYRKHEYQKADAERPAVRFQNAGYATIMQDISRSNDNGGQGNNVPSRPASNLYFDPSEVTRIYDEVNKESDHGVNSLNNTEASHLMYTGGTANVDDMADGYLSVVQSEASGATSGYCSSATEPKRSESEYVEMSGASLDSVEYENGSVSNNADSSNIKQNTTSNIGKDVNDLKPVKPGADGFGMPATVERQTNEYVEPSLCKREAALKQNNDSVCKEGQKNVEMHIYTNNLEVLESQKGRPLPPVPVNDYEVPVN